MIFAFPALINILMLLVLIYFIYAILGVFLFKGSSTDFENFGISFIELFRYSTGEDWHLSMFHVAEKNPVLGKIFFISFEFLTTFVLINMFVLVII